MSEEYQAMVRRAVLDDAHFVRLTAKGPIRGGQTSPWQRVVVRPVAIKGGRHLQFSYFTERQDTTKNYQGREAEQKLDELLAIPFGSLYMETLHENVQVQLTKKGKALVHRSKPGGNVEPRQPSLEHNARKDVPLPADTPDRFLQGVGIMNAQGQVSASMADKFKQINEFLKLLEHTGAVEGLAQPVNIFDAGCGSAYLSFAVYHYLNHVRGIEARLLGVDTNQRLIDKSNRLAADLGYTDMVFVQAPIVAYDPEPRPNLLLALHACDTATDEALFQGIRAATPVIMSVPCCHHHLHEQLKAREPFGPVFGQGILRQRLGDILTDTFRALILRIMGYKTDVVEFISPEHTDRNLMIRAVKRTARGDQKIVQEYEALKRYWHVVPFLETLLKQRGLWPEREEHAPPRLEPPRDAAAQPNT